MADEVIVECCVRGSAPELLKMFDGTKKGGEASMRRLLRLVLGNNNRRIHRHLYDKLQTPPNGPMDGIAGADVRERLAGKIARVRSRHMMGSMGKFGEEGGRRKPLRSVITSRAERYLGERCSGPVKGRILRHGQTAQPHHATLGTTGSGPDRK